VSNYNRINSATYRFTVVRRSRMSDSTASRRGLATEMVWLSSRGQRDADWSSAAVTWRVVAQRYLRAVHDGGPCAISRQHQSKPHSVTSVLSDLRLLSFDALLINSRILLIVTRSYVEIRLRIFSYLCFQSPFVLVFMFVVTFDMQWRLQ